MTALSASRVPLAVRVKSDRYDGMLTGFIIGAIKFQTSDPGGFKSASFTVSQRLGFRTDMVKPYSRIYIMDTCSGDVVFEGDVAHPGRSVSGDGPLLEVVVDGGMERLNDWSGPRIYCDSDLTAWQKNNGTSHAAAIVETGADKGGSGDDALLLALPDGTHVDLNSRPEAIYSRVAEASQQLGRINY